MVPLGGNTLECQAELFALTGSQRRHTQIDRIRIWATGLEHMQRDIFSLRDIAHRVLKDDVNHGMSDCSFYSIRGRYNISSGYNLTAFAVHANLWIFTTLFIYI